MNKEFEDFIKKNEAHDVAIVFCGNNKTIGKAVVSFFFSYNPHTYNIYRICNKNDLNNQKDHSYANDIDSLTFNSTNDKLIFIVSDVCDKKLLERDLYRAKVEYQLDDTVFLPKQNISSYIKSLCNNYNSVIKYYAPGGFFGLMPAYHTAGKEMIYGIPDYSNAERFIELYKSIAAPFENRKEILINQDSPQKHSFGEVKDEGGCNAEHCGDAAIYKEQNFENFCDILKSETGIDFVFCPAGNFIMGSPDDELGRINEYGHEEKQIEVEFEKPFFIGKYPIVDIQYEFYADKYLLDKFNLNNQSVEREKSKNLFPIVDVSYDDALHFCDLLNKKYADLLPDNYKFSLPTESQWEYACRAGTITAFNNGKNLSDSNEESEKMIDEIAWSVNCNIYRHIVGLKKPNNWGLYDMHGNICEWCINDQNRKNTKEEIYDAVGKGGSCFFRNIACCRSAAWLGFSGKDVEYPYVGFRLALVPIY